MEDILLDTAHKFTAGGPYEADPQNPRQTTSFDKGAGVADAVAALRDPRIGLAGSGDQLRRAWDRTAAETGANFGPTSTVLADGDGGDANLMGRRTSSTASRGGLAAFGAESPDDPATAEAKTVTRIGDSISFFVPCAELGSPASRAPVHNVRVASYIPAVHDVAPSPAANPTAGDLELRPLYAPPTVGV